MNANLLDGEGNSPLYYAVIHRQVNLVGLLLSRQACVNDRDRSGNSLLHLAILTGQLKTTLMLLSRDDIDYNARNNNGETVLALAASRIRFRKPCEEFATLVLDALLCKEGFDASAVNASLNVQDSRGNSPLHIAVLYRQYDVMRNLLLKNAQVNL